ncbi:MAG: tetratricopeptide repeat protein [Vicinamibacterales bacterium]
MPSNRRLVVALVAAALAAAPASTGARQKAPKLTKAQRQTLEVLVDAVDHASTDTVAAATWQHHVLRVSDGAHYVALRALVPGVAAPPGTVATYVRLVPTGRGAAGAPPRSAVRDWLAGLRGDPLPMQAGRSVTVPQGEMPVGGAAVSTRRAGDATAAMEAASALRLMDLQRERDARERAARDAERQAALESAERMPTEMLPFEDFEFEMRPAPLAGGGSEIQRGITAGPGRFDVFVAWATGQGKAAAVHVIRHALDLPPASTDFALSDLIVAERVAALASPYAPTEQGRHPYAIGALDVTPAAGNALSADGTLGLVFQVINPAGTSGGKPSVDVGFEVSRLADGGRTTAFGSLMTQHYDGDNLPADFDVGKGHPLFGAVRAPLTTFPRGRYKVVVTAVDRVAGRRAVGETTFEVRGTADSLLREAPGPGQAFQRDRVLTPPTRAALRAILTPPSPSEGLAAALAALEAGQYAALLRVGPAEPLEQPAVQALLGVGLFGLGDSPRAVIAQLTQAANRGAPAAAVGLVLGAAHAAAGDDRSAITALLAARDAGMDEAAVAPLLIQAYLRIGDVARAAAMATATLDAQPANLGARRALAATLVATRRPGEALRVLDAAPDGGADDPETRFLALHALFAGWVVKDPALTSEPMRERFARSGARYVEDGLDRADLVREWLAVASADARR